MAQTWALSRQNLAMSGRPFGALALIAKIWSILTVSRQISTRSRYDDRLSWRIWKRNGNHATTARSQLVRIGNATLSGTMSIPQQLFVRQIYRRFHLKHIGHRVRCSIHPAQGGRFFLATDQYTGSMEVDMWLLIERIVQWCIATPSLGGNSTSSTNKRIQSWRG